MRLHADTLRTLTFIEASSIQTGRPIWKDTTGTLTP